jgi:WD40 repeat protein
MVRLWDIGRLRELARLKGHSGPVRCVAFSRDGARLASVGSDGSIRLWDVDAGRAATTLWVSDRVIYAVALSPDGTRLASGDSDGRVKLWDAVTWHDHELASFVAHRGAVSCVTFAPDGTRLATGSTFDGVAKIWYGGETRARAVGR